jgi:hypothetical protein
MPQCGFLAQSAAIIVGQQSLLNLELDALD